MPPKNSEAASSHTAYPNKEIHMNLKYKLVIGINLNI
jgi:hypothetical protein